MATWWHVGDHYERKADNAPRPAVCRLGNTLSFRLRRRAFRRWLHTVVNRLKRYRELLVEMKRDIIPAISEAFRGIPGTLPSFANLDLVSQMFLPSVESLLHRILEAMFRNAQ